MVDHGWDDGTNKELKFATNAVTSLLVTTRAACTNFGHGMARSKSGRRSDKVRWNVEASILSKTEVEWMF